jgi:hypothetical protein
MSQATFALALNVPKMLVSKWSAARRGPLARPSSSSRSSTPRGSTPFYECAVMVDEGLSSEAEALEPRLASSDVILRLIELESQSGP